MSAARLTGKIAMITGAAAGIGRAISLRFAEEGAAVVICDVDTTGTEQTMDLLHATGSVVHPIALDVSDEPAWETAIEEVRSKFGRLDILVNNAGLPYRRSLAESSWSEWQHLMLVNAGGAFLGMKHGTRAIAGGGGGGGGGGSIVNVSSAAAIVGVPGMTTYSATKGAIRAMSRAAASELAAADVRINSVYPTSVPTAMLASDAHDTGVAVDTFRTAAAALSPLDGIASAADVTSAVLYLASDEARFITGAELVIDGGATSLLG